MASEAFVPKDELTEPTQDRKGGKPGIKTLRIYTRGSEWMLRCRKLLRPYEKVIPAEDACVSQRLVLLAKAALFLGTEELGLADW